MLYLSIIYSMKHNYDFWNNKVPKGFYDEIFIKGKAIMLISI